MNELLGADTDVLDRSAESLSTDSRRVQDIRTQAQRAVTELQACWTGSDLSRLTLLWEQRASPLLAGASESLETCAAGLRAQSAAQRATSSDRYSGPGFLSSGLASSGLASSGLAVSGMANLGMVPLLPPAYPPKAGSPANNATWWRSLSPEQQVLVITAHPDWIGNRDGVAFAVRDRANRAMLDLDRSRLVTEKARLETVVAVDWAAGAIPTDDVALGQVNDKLAALTAIEATLARPGARQLVLLDLGQERAQAAISSGDIDTAANVAVLVPGMTTTVNDNMKGYDQQMDQIRHRAEQESRRANPLQDATTATVTWIGYQAPRKGWDLIRPGTSVASESMANGGAAQLAPFLQGIGAARESDAHLTLLAHSYGTTTAGLALRESTGVDDVVFFGSPGLGTSHLEDLKVADGHAFYIEARQDAVGDLGVFGIDPSHLSGIEHTSAQASTVVDPVTGQIRHFTEVTGHSSYLANESTSQYNMSVVVAGVPDRRVYDRGEGIGDVLSWPLPGTY